MAQPRFQEAADAVARIAGASPEEIFFEIQGDVVIVNWQDSMLCVDRHAEIRKAVQDNMPTKYRGQRVAIT